MSTQYVQSIYSNDAPKHKLHEKTMVNGNAKVWCCPIDNVNGFYWLPKSEYKLCNPPEIWVDVTKDCRIVSRCEYNILEIYHGSILVNGENGYRVSKVKCCDAGGLGCGCGRREWAFIVEKLQ